MFESLLASSVIILGQVPDGSPQFMQLKTQLENYGFEVNIAIPPSFEPPEQQPGIKRTIKNPYGLLNSQDKSIWINPIVFDLGIAESTLIHESVHAAQYCFGHGNIQKIGLDLEPLPQALPFFKRYVDTQRQDLEREAYTVQTQANSYQLTRALLDEYCQ